MNWYWPAGLSVGAPSTVQLVTDKAIWAQLRTTTMMMRQERNADHRIGVNLVNAITGPKRCSALRR